MKGNLKPLIIPSIPMMVFLVIIAVALWFIPFVAEVFGLSHYSPFDIEKAHNTISIPTGIISLFSSILLVLVITYMLVRFNTSFSFIRSRTFIPVLIFVTLISVWPDIHTSPINLIPVILLVIAFSFFFQIYRNTNASEQTFMTSLSLAVLSISVEPVILLIPIIWVGLIMLQSLSLRTFLASILGIFTPWVLYFASHILFFPDRNFESIITHIFTFNINLPHLPLNAIIYLVTLNTILIICVTGIFSSSNKDSIHTRIKLSFIIILIVATQAICFFFGNNLSLLLPFVAFLYATIVAHPFTLLQNRLYLILFWVFIGVNLSFLLSQYIDVL